MKRTPANAFPDPVEPFVHRRLAHRFYASRSGLLMEILDFLTCRPMSRYGDLKPLLRGRGDQVLNDALGTLQEEALVFQRGFGPKRSAYQLTSLGVAVRDVILELRAADRNSLVAHREAVKA